MMRSTRVTIQQLLLLIAIAMVVLADSILVSGQNINGRSGGDTDKPSEVSHSRTLYQKPLLPHRMMHFGKRQPLSRYSYPLIPYEGAIGNQIGAMPYSLGFVMDREARNMNRYYTGMPESEFVRLQPANEMQNDAAVFVASAPGQPNNRYPQAMKQQQTNQRLTMISNDTPTSTDEEEQQQQVQQQQQPNPSFISVQTRSMSGNGANGDNGQRGAAFNLPRSFISTLYGRQGEGLPGIGGYNKKAEPKDNFFMHFG